jgi:hypothetical protein
VLEAQRLVVALVVDLRVPPGPAVEDVVSLVAADEVVVIAAADLVRAKPALRRPSGGGAAVATPSAPCGSSISATSQSSQRAQSETAPDR